VTARPNTPISNVNASTKRRHRKSQIGAFDQDTGPPIVCLRAGGEHRAREPVHPTGHGKDLMEVDFDLTDEVVAAVAGADTAQRFAGRLASATGRPLAPG
jgi:hypothetical protein